MKQTMILKLQPTEAQSAELLTTMERFNAACNAIAGVAFRERVASKFKLQKLVYYDIRRDFGLSAQLTIRAIAKVSDAYKRDKAKRVWLRPHGAITYDERILSFKGLDQVSILTLSGRQHIPMRFGGYQAARMDRIKGQADLIFRDNRWYLAVTLDAPEPEPGELEGWLGCDLGIVNLLADSDGETYSGGQVNGLRQRHAKLRARLQAKGTRSAKRLLRKRRRKQQRFQRQVNHILAKTGATNRVEAATYAHRMGLVE